MLAEHGNISVGIDLGRDFSQITFCSKYGNEPITVVQKENNEANNYLIKTPDNLFSLIERKDSQGAEVLEGFFRDCFALLKTAGSVKDMTVMVTMHEMKGVWADAVRSALARIGVEDSDIFLQSHLESFFAYIMNQPKELCMYHVALLEYERDSITAWHFWLERKTKPVLARAEKCFRLYLDHKARKGRGDEEWGVLRDTLLHKNLEKMFENTPFSSAYLVGEEFQKGWMDKSLRFLCRKRKVSRFLTNVYVSLLISLLSLPAAAGVIPVLHDKVVIGAIMPLVPGIALTTSIRDFYNGDYLSGTIHLIDALLTALCIAVGIALPILLLRYGGNLPV